MALLTEQELNALTERQQVRLALASSAAQIKQARAEQARAEMVDDIVAAVTPRVSALHDVVPQGASILIVKAPWIDLILDGKKTLEIRGSSCRKRERVYLAKSGAGGRVFGSVEIIGCDGPLSRAAWKASSTQHCVPGAALPYGSRTHAWRVDRPVRFAAPVPYVHRKGTVVWAKM